MKSFKVSRLLNGCRLFVAKLIFWILLFAQPVVAQPLEIEVLGLFSGAALMRIDGKEKLLKVGGPAYHGIQLVNADSRQAVVEIDGKRSTMLLSDQISSDFAEPGNSTVSVQMNKMGQYITTGSINGHPVRFLVDTGANIVAMNSTTARSIGVDITDGRKMSAATAGGQIRSTQVFLDAVQVGGIVVNNVQAAVLEGEFPQEILLGMSFLRNVKIEENAGLMMLTSQL